MIQSNDLYSELKGYRNRRNKIQLDQARWDEQMPELVNAYMDFCNRRRSGQLFQAEVRERHVVSVWTTTGKCFNPRQGHLTQIPVFVTDTYTNASYIRSGYLPFNPLLNQTLVSLDTLELYHNLFMRCPRLGIQPFIRALCDLQGIRSKNNLSVQYSSAYDLYIRLVEAVRSKVLDALNRTTPHWRMLNNCPCCQYEVVGEPELPIRMLIAIDGNNSLKRFQRRESPLGDGQELGVEKERPDDRVGGGDYFLQEEQVNLWDESQWFKWPGWTPKEKSPKVPCEDRWSNMNEAKTKRSFGHFDVNGVFAGFCRHSFTIVFLDMVRSGEHSKYMLAFLYHFMTACLGYDIACGMVDKIARSPLSETAGNERLQMLIGLLHGYAHNCLCQLSFLLLYINGAGIEDLKVCERYFSHSNALAPVTRYMSKFRRRQAISNYVYHRDNLETYHNLSRFLYSNYKQVLTIIGRSKDTARVLKAVGLLDPNNAIRWLDEERKYLESRQKIPEEDALKSTYYLSLVKLAECQDGLARARRTFRLELGLAGVSEVGQDGDGLFLTERQMANAQEMEAKLLLDVQSFEERLELRRDQRWVNGSEEWKQAAELVSTAKYRKALDRLEGLIVARIFELSKMNLAGTGYKMRQHIGDAMKKRSKAILSALDNYNEAAAALKPPRKLLGWDDVLNYTYLSEFDFLRDTQTDILQKPWAKPAVREAMSELFKLMRAGEELDRLHVEIKRLVTNMKEEEEYIRRLVRKVRRHNEALSFQIWLHGNERRRFNGIHRRRLRDIQRLKGFSQSDAHYFQPGVGIRRQTVDGEEDGADLGLNGGDDSDSDESDGDDEDVDDRAEAVLAIANDTVE
ncbi:hypothetical protein DFJ43DRAFT_1003285 [Lentinula guzmanii]|uniref:CxC1-like cysteine cluster associated with KDZ transposases domain-containing protein n=1 Tax=Lentinula guzmanii TaxID=2804957 RepID=A0AA38MX92_9AGAR|nr:hypothetical protein DFJ43DRAFT_1003285 [Lentinula guzmanii]